MPQMNKGGKWVFGWCVVSAAGEIQIPPAAYAEYGFQPGGAIVYLRGSHRSGGFSVGRMEMLTGAANLLLSRSLGQGVILDEERVAIPSGLDIQPGGLLLAVRGSGFAVLFLRHGPIFDEATKHTDIEVFA
jgi:hypothetical protein